MWWLKGAAQNGRYRNASRLLLYSGLLSIQLYFNVFWVLPVFIVFLCDSHKKYGWKVKCLALEFEPGLSLRIRNFFTDKISELNKIHKKF
jgi:hypothetical protein